MTCLPGNRYDVVWIQWCLLYLTDEDAISFFHRCQKALKPGGKIIVKENICQDGFVVDKDDSSLSRSNAYMMKLFDQAGMQASTSLSHACTKSGMTQE